jgi:hypothetical protein
LSKLTKELAMKKYALAAVSVLAVAGFTVGAASATASRGTVPARVLSSSATQRAATMSALQTKLRSYGNRKLSTQTLRSLGLRPVSGSLAKHHLKLHVAHKADVYAGSYWYTYHYAGFAWVNRYIYGPFYSYPWYPYYYLYDNFYLCNYANSGCTYTHLWYYEYYLYYYPSGTWYTYGPQGYNDSEYGPFSG